MLSLKSYQSHVLHCPPPQWFCVSLMDFSAISCPYKEIYLEFSLSAKIRKYWHHKSFFIQKTFVRLKWDYLEVVLWAVLGEIKKICYRHYIFNSLWMKHLHLKFMKTSPLSFASILSFIFFDSAIADQLLQWTVTYR